MAQANLSKTSELVIAKDSVPLRTDVSDHGDILQKVISDGKTQKKAK
jgi:hypothetical protein